MDIYIFFFYLALKNKTIFQEALDRYNQLDYSEINSRVIREMAYNFNESNCILPIAMEAMFKYIENNYSHVIGETVEKVLSCAYNLGYTPKSEAVLNSTAFILKRYVLLLNKQGKVGFERN